MSVTDVAAYLLLAFTCIVCVFTLVLAWAGEGGNLKSFHKIVKL
jgi:hypothetical protein